MFDIGGPEIIVILLGIIVLFGPKKIPEIAQMIGKGIQKVRTAQSQFNDQIKEIQTEMEKSTEDEKTTPKGPPIKEVSPGELKTEHLSEEQEPSKEDPEPEEYKEVESTKRNFRDSKNFGFEPVKPKKDNNTLELKDED